MSINNGTTLNTSIRFVMMFAVTTPNRGAKDLTFTSISSSSRFVSNLLMRSAVRIQMLHPYKNTKNLTKCLFFLIN